MDPTRIVRPTRPRLAVGTTILLVAAAGWLAGCGPAQTLRGYRPDVDGFAIGDGADLGRAVGALEVVIDGGAADETPEARRRRLGERVREALAARGWYLDAGRPGTTVRVTVHAGPAPETIADAARDAGTPGDWAPVAVAIASEIRGASLAAEVARGAPSAPAPTVAIEVEHHGIEAWRAAAPGRPGVADPVEAVDDALRVLVTHLPDRRADRVAPAPEIPAAEAAAFYADACAGRELVCPGLPFPVRFPDLEAAYHKSLSGAATPWKDTSVAHVLEPPELLPAFLRLVRTADRVLPGGRGARRHPTDPVVWEKATLVEEMLVDGERAVVWVRVADVPSGYVVKEAGVADWQEGPALLAELAAWEEAAREAR